MDIIPISADDHIWEHPTTWTSRVEARFRDCFPIGLNGRGAFAIAPNVRVIDQGNGRCARIRHQQQKQARNNINLHKIIRSIPKRTDEAIVLP